jgi:type IV secretory pathway VirB4 component
MAGLTTRLTHWKTTKNLTSGNADARTRPVLGPSGGVEVGPRWLRLGDTYAASFTVVGYPAQVGAGWLEPLTCYPGRLDLAVFIDPVPPQAAAARLRRQLGRLESTRQTRAHHGRLESPEVDLAAADARDLAAALASGNGRLFRVGLYLTCHAATPDDLTAHCAQVRAIAASLLLDAQPASFRTLQGWVTTLPLATDRLEQRRTFDTDALAAAMPFASPDLPTPDVGPWTVPHGVVYGANAASAGLVVWDRWACDNHNTVILARSGAGKSYLTKLDLLRSLYQGVEAAVIDPEDEYARLCAAVGGAYLHLGAPGVRINPLDLPATLDTDPDNGAPTADTAGDVLADRAIAVHTLVAVMLGEPLSPAGRAALDRAVIAAYQQAGITADPRTWRRPAPILADLATQLHADSDPAAALLAAGLAPYVTGSWRHLFDGPTTTRPEGHLVVFSLRDLPDELKTLGTLLTLDCLWRHVTNPRRRCRRIVVVDEAWLIMRDPEGAKFLYRMAKSARKYWTGLTVVTQDAADLLGTPLGQAVVANAATQILLRQAPQAIDAIGEAFDLSDGERAWLVSAEKGTGLLIAGPGQRVALQVLASATENALITTDAAELADLDA